MALDTVISNAAASAGADAVTALVDVGGAGTIKIYGGGSGKPATPETAVTDQTEIVSITCEATAFGAASNGVCTLDIGAGKSGTGAGGGPHTAQWFRVSSGAGTAIFDGTCGTSDADMILDNTSINTGQTVSISSMTYTHPTT